MTFAQASAGALVLKHYYLCIRVYHNESIKLNKIIKALTSNPAKILKIDKGNLSIGNDADFCVVDINKPWIVKKENLVSKSKIPLRGKKITRKVLNTYVNGEELLKFKYGIIFNSFCLLFCRFNSLV